MSTKKMTINERLVNAGFTEDQINELKEEHNNMLTHKIVDEYIKDTVITTEIIDVEFDKLKDKDLIKMDNINPLRKFTDEELIEINNENFLNNIETSDVKKDTIKTDEIDEIDKRLVNAGFTEDQINELKEEVKEEVKSEESKISDKDIIIFIRTVRPDSLIYKRTLIEINKR
jgi:hypothetical protein